MSDRLKKYGKISKIVFGTLLSLSIYGLATHAIEWGSEKCANVSSFDGKKVKIIIMIILVIISVLFIIKDFGKKIATTVVKSSKPPGPLSSETKT